MRGGRGTCPNCAFRDVARDQWSLEAPVYLSPHRPSSKLSRTAAVRTRSKAIFEKSSPHSQTDSVRLVLNVSPHF